MCDSSSVSGHCLRCGTTQLTQSLRTARYRPRTLQHVTSVHGVVVWSVVVLLVSWSWLCEKEMVPVSLPRRCLFQEHVRALQEAAHSPFELVLLVD